MAIARKKTLTKSKKPTIARKAKAKVTSLMSRRSAKPVSRVRKAA